ncbi:MAG: sulfatase-like hydrolase/transferase [Verrucomicrobiota bacterium]
MKNTIAIGLVCTAVAAWGARGVEGAEVKHPNVIVFLMDDLGWNDLGYTGSKFYESPNIDRLSTRGVIFTRAYAAPISSPSRASILTGLDPATTGFTSPRGGDPLEVLKACVQPRIYTQEELKTNWRELPGGMKATPPNQRALQVVSASRLSTEYPSIAKIFKANGYRTGHFGKWHVGPVPYSALEHGFDVDVPHINTPGPIRPGHLGPWPDWEGENVPQNKGRNIDDCLADHAIKFIQENKDHPFYMNFWSYGVHVPIQARKEMIDYFKAKKATTGQDNSVYAAMIKSTDAAFGRVWKAVEQAGLADNTVLVFYSDNGGVNYGTPRITDNSPLRGGKGDTWEGGVRVPGFVIWPGVTKAGTKCDLPVNTRDLFPTLAEVCRLKDLPKFDGRSVAPALAGKAMEEKPIFTYLPQYGWHGEAPVAAVMFEGWKLFRHFYDGPGQTHRYELYNLKEDVGETLDYHRSRPDVAAKLTKILDDYLKETGAVVPQPNPAYKGAIKGEFEGLSYEVLEPMFKRGVKFPLVVCLGGDGNPAYEQFHKAAIQNKHSVFLLSLKYPPAGTGNDSIAAADKVAALIGKVLQDYPIEAWRVYVTGQGKGATDAWVLAQRHPKLFAAVLPVGDIGSPGQAAVMKELPVWAFHGVHDPKAPATGAHEMDAALKAAGSTVAKYTEYTQNDQVLLDNVWDNPEVLEWLFAQRQGPPKRISAAPTSQVVIPGDIIGFRGGMPGGSADDDDYDPGEPGLADLLLLQANAQSTR